MSADRLTVRRVQDERGSHIEPPLDPDASPIRQLHWQAAVVALDTGLVVRVHPVEHHEVTPGRSRIHSRYSVQVGSSSMTSMSFHDAWLFLSGVSVGVMAARSSE